jgi:hypothetical protein
MIWIILGLLVTGALITYALMPAVAYNDAVDRAENPRDRGVGETIGDAIRLLVTLWMVGGCGFVLMIAAVWLFFHAR